MRFRLTGREDWQRLRDYVAGLPWVRDGKAVRYLVTVEEMRPGRSHQANAHW